MKVKGQVKDGKGEGLFNVNVSITDANGRIMNPPQGMATDFDGFYEINNINGDYVTFSSVGYGKRIIPIKTIKNPPTLDLTLYQTSEQLPEFTVIAEKDEPSSLARKDKRNYMPYIIGGVSLLVLIGGYFTYKKLKG
jgi:hypothetical protein